ncbi:MAG TPA: crosslink repair DNA glycosylase YcaQ family protein [Chthonomonadaceae bacterium]|nr:crosslink repair DNA glycosylase YcaQ family protein [Chthonomonadaceae bacterium]
MRLSNMAARSLLLAAQGLQERPAEPARKADCLAAIRRMGLLQIDTISVVARSPYLVLWSRLGDYEPRWLEELLAEGALFEYWSHAACFLPIEDFCIYRRRMLDYAEDDAYLPSGLNAQNAEKREVVERVLSHIRERGAARSADFPYPRDRARTWWDWKPEKIALEHLFNAGVLMIARREGFQRIYDLRERVLPDWNDAHTHTPKEARRQLTLKAVRALGIARAKWLAGSTGYFGNYLRTQDVKAILTEEIRTGEALAVTVEGSDEPAYVHRDNGPLMEQAAEGALASTMTTFLSPFDPVVSHRGRARELFGFDYQIETYTPAERRRYGYFSLPILHRGHLVGRLDAKAHRQEGLFEVKSLHLEAKTPITDTLLSEIAATLTAFAQWHKTPEIVLRLSDPPDFAVALRAALTAVKEKP